MKKEKLLENSLRLLVFVIGIFSICIVLLTVKLKVDAASPTVLPYLANNSEFSIDSATAEDIVSKIKADFPESDFGDYYIIFCTSENVWQTWWDNVPSLAYNVYFFDYTGLESTWSSGTTFSNFQFNDSSCYMDVTCTHVATLIYQQLNERGYTTTQNIGTYSRRLFGDATPIDISNSFFTYSYLQNYPVYCNADFTTLHLGDGEGSIVSNGIPYSTDEFQTGHAVEPSFDSDTIIDSGLHPNVLPSSPQYTTYNITTYQAPQIDTSSVENLLKSIWDVISYTGQYIISNVGGFINNIWNNISLGFGYIGDLLSYLFNKVINTIKQSVNNLFDNFKDLFEPVLNSFANMINIFNTLYSLGLKDGVFDIPTLFGALFVPNQSDLALLVDTFVEFDYLQTASVSIKSLLLGIFDVLNDDAVYSIHLQGFTFHGVTVPEQEISFDWYLPYKATGDIFISAFLIVGYLYWLWTRISGIFHGAVPDSQGASSITLTDHSSEFSGFPF